MQKIIMLAFILFPSICSAGQVNTDMAVGCPTVKAYKTYLSGVTSGSNPISLGAALDCRMMFKGDKVEVIEWKALSNLVRVHPEDNSMTFWMAGELVDN